MVLIQCLLYASLVISLFAAFVAMLGKERLDRFARNKGRAAAEKSWDRQRRSRGMEQWKFYFIMEVRFGCDEGIRTFGFGLGLVRIKRDAGLTAGPAQDVIWWTYVPAKRNAVNVDLKTPSPLWLFSPHRESLDPIPLCITDRQHPQQGAVAQWNSSRLEICSGDPCNRLEIC